MKKARKISMFLLFSALLLVSCGGQPPAAPTMDVNTILTQSVGTFVAQVFQTQTAMVTPATPTPLNTPTFIPTSTPMPLPSLASPTYVVYNTAIVYPSVTPTGTQYTATPNPSTLGYGCNNLGLINDLEISGGSTLQPGQSFTKTWQVANTGTCNWNYTYDLIFISGNDMNGASVSLGKKIEPNKWTRLSVNLTAPSKEGTYTGYWRLSDGAGHAFGATLPVTITVKEAQSYP